MDIKVMTEEEYLSINGASRQDIGDSALHKNRGRNSDKSWRKIVEAQAKKDRELIVRRGELREEFKKKVDAGEIRLPSVLESLKKKASGLPERQDVQAARRLLERRGINWKAFTPVENHVCPF